VTGGDAGRDQIGALRKEGALTIAELAEPQVRRPFDDSAPQAGDGIA